MGALPRLPKGYKPSPQPSTLYVGPATPTAYDSNWQTYTNLTPDQMAWFKAQPEWQNYLAYVAQFPTRAGVGVPTVVVNTALQIAGVQ